ncbi:hypothetical protein Lal_00036296 [Lupinus albus]|nr:hypothetical protein Lal_00036296 [Lupinus albus]
MKAGGSSSTAGGKTAARMDSYYSPNLKATKLAKFHGRRLTYIRYADVSWLVEQGFESPHQLELQGANAFLEMQESVGVSWQLLEVVRETIKNGEKLSSLA